MLIELAVGDAYGAGFEYARPDFVARFNDCTRYVKHPRHGIQPGAYTDDTQMSIAVCEALLAAEDWTRELLADRFVQAFKRDPREGYAQRFYHFLREVSDGAEFLANIIPTSDKSGAAMRAAPIGLLNNLGEVLNKCELQARITHDTPKGVHAALAAALATHYFYHDIGPRAGLGKFIEKHVPGNWSDRYKGKVGSKGWMSVKAAITALAECSGMSDLLQRCIAFTGDVDTVASIALAAGRFSREIKQNLPQDLFDGLERGPYGFDYLSSLDEQLQAAYPRRSVV